MTSCLSIRLKNKPNYEYCQSYRVTANEDGTGAGVMASLCGGNINTQRWIPSGNSWDFCALFGSVPTKINGDSSISIEQLGLCTDQNSVVQNESIYFDLPDGFTLRETKRITELTESNTLKFNYTIGFNLDTTKKNFDLIKTRINPNVLDNQYKELEVEVIMGSRVISDAQLYVKKFVKKEISVELRLSVNHWAINAKSLLLRDLPYAEVTYGCDLITDVVVNQYPYQLSQDFNDPNNLGIWFPFVDYGRLVRDISNSGRVNEWILPVCYNRPWYYVTGILQRGFCALGYQFVSPLFESDIGRKLLVYVMDRSYGLSGQVYEQRKNNLNVRASSVGDSAIVLQYGNKSGSVWWPQITFDPVGSLDPIEGFYSACGQVNVRGKVTIESLGDSEKIDIHIARLNPQEGYGGGTGGSFKFEPLKSRSFSSLEDPITWEFEMENISISSSEQLCILVEREGGGALVLKDGSFIEFQGVRPYPSEGDIENLQNLIDGEYTFLNFLKGLSSVMNLKVKTDFGRYTVELYQPYRSDFWGEDLEGFFIEETIEDIDIKVNPQSAKVETPKTDQSRFVTISYADSTDSYIDSLELSNELFSNKIDLGEKFTEKESQGIKNQFFEPTVNRNSSFANAFGMHIPKIGTEYEYGFDINPRIIIARGHVIQELDNINNPVLRMCSFDAIQSPLIPTASMFTPLKIGVVHNDENSAVNYPKSNLAYGINPEISTYKPDVTLYDIVYRRWLLEQLNNLKLEYLLDLSTYDYKSYDFRKSFRFTHMGRPVVSRMQLIKDYHYCAIGLQTPVTFIPQRQLSNICDLLIPTDGTNEGSGLCENNPYILCTTIQTGHYVFTIIGQNNSPILSATFEYSIDDGVSWVSLPPLTVVSAQVNPIYTSFLVRAFVNYAEVNNESCPSIDLPPKKITPCPVYDYNLQCEQTTVYDPLIPNVAIDAVRVVTSLPLGQDITVVNSQYSIDGGSLQNYPVTLTTDSLVGSSVHGGLTIDFTITLQIGNCPSITLVKQCLIDPPQDSDPLNCGDISMILECDEQAGGCWLFNRSGYLFGENDNYIKYRCSNDGITYGPWLLWDEVTEICCSHIQARWWAVFCGNQCPPQCSPITECQTTCIPFDVGTITNIALCN